MATEEERCAEAKKFQRIDEAFHKGDLDALRVAVDDPAVVPNGRMPDTIGSCLIYAIYHSPLAFIRRLLEITEVRIDRRSLVNGLFYGVEGMRVGGTRRLEIGPHLAYGDRGVPGAIPAGAVLTAEITILGARASTP
jgi:hypothetical protein